MVRGAYASSAYPHQEEFRGVVQLLGGEQLVLLETKRRDASAQECVDVLHLEELHEVESSWDDAAA